MYRLSSRLSRGFAIASVALLVLVAPVAAADPHGATGVSPLATVHPDVATPSVAHGSGVKAATSTGYELNPWGCSTQTQNPHLSGHYLGTVAAVAIHNCNGYYGANPSIRTYPTTQTLEAWLYYNSCFLFIFCSWNQVDHWSSGPVSSSVSINLGHTLAANCNNGNSTSWRLDAHGTSFGWNGSSYTTYASDSQNNVTLACGR